MLNCEEQKVSKSTKAEGEVCCDVFRYFHVYSTVNKVDR